MPSQTEPKTPPQWAPLGCFPLAAGWLGNDLRNVLGSQKLKVDE